MGMHNDKVELNMKAPQLGGVDIEHAAKTLKMRKFGITWEKILPSPSAIGALLALV